MRKVVAGVLVLMLAVTVLEGCSSKLCPAYNSYPTAKR